jgi:nucleoporin NUP82
VNPRLSLPPSPAKGGGGTREFMLTPDVLRYFATTVAALSAQMQDVQLAYRAADARATLQQAEQTRLSQKCAEMEASVSMLRGARRAKTEDRFTRVREEQRALHGRLERMLRGLMDRASPELSEYETKWFGELKRMQGEVVGAGRYDEGSLVARTRMVRCVLIFAASCYLNFSVA